MRVSGEPALIMQVKPFRETSSIVHCFARDGGRLALVHRGARRRRSPMSGLQPFHEVQVSYSGRGGMMTLYGAELLHAHRLSGDHLAAGFYVFELLARLLREHDGHPRLYAITRMVIDGLHQCQAPAPLLRVFERRLLEEIGFGIHFRHDAAGQQISAERWYALRDGEAFEQVSSPDGSYSGTALLAIHDDDYSGRSTRVAAREIFRVALAPHLGPKPLTSRALLKAPH